MDKPAACPGRQGHARGGSQRRAATTPGFSLAAFTSQVAKKSLRLTKARAGTAELTAHAVSQGDRARHTQGLPMEMGSPPYLRASSLPAAQQPCQEHPPSPPRLSCHITASQARLLTCDSLQISPYHLPRDSSKFTSYSRAPTRTISGLFYLLSASREQPSQSHGVLRHQGEPATLPPRFCKYAQLWQGNLHLHPCKEAAFGLHSILNRCCGLYMIKGHKKIGPLIPGVLFFCFFITVFNWFCRIESQSNLLIPI